MLKVISFVLVVGAAAIVSTLAMESPGEAVITWMGYEIHTVVPVILATMFIFYFAFYLLVLTPIRIVKSVVSAPSKISDNMKKKKQEKEKIKNVIDETKSEAKEELSQEVQEQNKEIIALKKASFDFMIDDVDSIKEVQQQIPQESKNKTIIDAMTAKLEKDYEKSISLFEKVYNENSGEVRIYAAKELVISAQKQNNTKRALEILNKLYDDDIHLEWIVRNRFASLAKEKMWEEAIKTLDVGMEKKLSSKERYKRLKATILYEMSKEAEEKGDENKAKELAIKAKDTDHSLSPAAERAAHFYINEGQDRKAAAAISETWRMRPIPALAEAYVKLWPEEDQFLQVQRIEQLSLSNKKHPVGRLVAADFNIRARLWGPARKHLDVFMAKMPTTKKAARLMAEFEEGGNKDHATANRWLKDVEKADPDARWICTDCGAQPGDWYAVCPSCGEFATYEWLTPGYTLEEEIAKEEGELKEKIEQEKKQREEELEKQKEKLELKNDPEVEEDDFPLDDEEE